MNMSQSFANVANVFGAKTRQKTDKAKQSTLLSIVNQWIASGLRPRNDGKSDF
jgi:hypothetical protein